MRSNQRHHKFLPMRSMKLITLHCICVRSTALCPWYTWLTETAVPLDVSGGAIWVADVNDITLHLGMFYGPQSEMHVANTISGASRLSPPPPGHPTPHGTAPFSHIPLHFSGISTQPPFPLPVSHPAPTFATPISSHVHPIPALGQVSLPVYSYVRTLTGIIGTIDAPVHVTPLLHMRKQYPVL